MTTPYEGLTEDETAQLIASSAQQPGEDASSWAARTKADAEKAATLAAERRVAAEAAGETEDVEGEQ